MKPTDLEQSQQIVELIRDLTENEGDEVTIMHTSGGESMIEVIQDFGAPQQFWSNSVLECLLHAKMVLIGP